MTEPAPAQPPRRPVRKPGPAAVVWGSLALFAVLFALIAHQLSASLAGTSTAPRPTLVRTVVKRKVVTTVVPTPGRSTVAAGPALTSEAGTEPAPVVTGAS
ncbi:MAG: hypothetical protein ACTHO8_08015 [Solirubrobacterales bacterium]